MTELQRICVLIDQRIATCISDDAVKMENDSKQDWTFNVVLDKLSDKEYR